MAPHGQAMMLAHLSRMYAALGELELAGRHNREAVQLALTTEDMPLAAAVVETAVDVNLAAGETELGARTLGLAAAMKGMQSISDADVRKSVERLRDALGNEKYDATYAAGAALTKDEAVAELRKRYSTD
jgi:hypothetical protein